MYTLEPDKFPELCCVENCRNDRGLPHAKMETCKAKCKHRPEFQMCSCIYDAEIGRLTQELDRANAKAAAWDMIATRGEQAQDYCRSNIRIHIGENVWHAILEDAIYMRITLRKLLGL